MLSNTTTVDLNALVAPDVGIVTDLFSISDVVSLDPNVEFQITFNLPPDKRYKLTQSNRQLFNSSLAENCPEVTWNRKPDASYTISFVDIDYPMGRFDESNDKGLQFLLWMANKISDPKEIDSTLVSYLAPVPISNSTGSHRYVFVLMEESARTPYPAVGLSKAIAENGEEYTEREHFNLTAFRVANDLQLTAVDYFISPPLTL